MEPELSAKADPINSSLAGLAGARGGQASRGLAVQDSLFSLGGLDSCLTLHLEGELGSVFNPWTQQIRGSKSCSQQFHFLEAMPHKTAPEVLCEGVSKGQMRVSFGEGSGV